MIFFLGGGGGGVLEIGQKTYFGIIVKMKCTFTIVKAIMNRLLGFHPSLLKMGVGLIFFLVGSQGGRYF